MIRRAHRESPRPVEWIGSRRREALLIACRATGRVDLARCASERPGAPAERGGPSDSLRAILLDELQELEAEQSSIVDGAAVLRSADFFVRRMRLSSSIARKDALGRFASPWQTLLAASSREAAALIAEVGMNVVVAAYPAVDAPLPRWARAIGECRRASLPGDLCPRLPSLDAEAVSALDELGRRLARDRVGRRLAMSLGRRVAAVAWRAIPAELRRGAVQIAATNLPTRLNSTEPVGSVEVDDAITLLTLAVESVAAAVSETAPQGANPRRSAS